MSDNSIIVFLLSVVTSFDPPPPLPPSHRGLYSLCDQNGYTALLLAAEKGHKDICSLLADRGAKFDSTRLVGNIHNQATLSHIRSLVAEDSQPRHFNLIGVDGIV